MAEFRLSDRVLPVRRLIAQGAMVLAVAWVTSACQPPATSGAASSPDAAAAKPQFNGIDITGAKYAQDFALPDVTGQVRHLADFKGKVTVVFFGYTQCPDVCPTTMVELAAARKALGASGKDVQGIFITLDPERDTAPVLKGYVDNFGADFVALRGTPEQTQAAAKDFKIFFAKVPGSSPGSYTLDHTAGSYVFDPQGRVRLFTRYGVGAESLQHDLAQLLKGA